ncbi:hypothetical protein NIES2119_29060 [[Phormidium ambiguum] IAM M-71]|uniref:Uncharacterized protein n=1 Tax=[Phormidium ambiguum] IAM M-71 TaxID=454136 RepID=A0A1U7I4V9_9CYAN|nr:hypothetical protein [Phormidium ambiguum]OKH31263.1 hypothetical protein NIES2119_29060 [Phormidium ambiguum IAM M-71]
MREIQDLTTVSNAGNHLIGYERLLDYWKDIQQQCPKGVGLKKDTKASGTYVLLQFTIGLKRTAKACNCPFTFEGIANALSKAKAVRDALDRFSTESDFWEWYDSEILEKNRIKNDLITFREAIEKVETFYWKGHTKKHGKRDKTNPSHQESWHSTYGVFFKKVNPENAINLPEIKSVIESYEEAAILILK